MLSVDQSLEKREDILFVHQSLEKDNILYVDQSLEKKTTFHLLIRVWKK
jgi:hypothetical protein